MKKRKIIMTLIQSLFFYSILSFLIPNVIFAEGNVTISESLGYTQKSEVQEARERYLKAMRACRGTKKVYSDRKVVALTFDDGPNGRYTRRILKILNDNNIRGTFFFIGENMENQPDLVKYADAYGHIVANHSYSHNYLNDMSDRRIQRELTKTSDITEGLIGKYPLLFRPPYGSCCDRSAKAVHDMGFKTIMWSAIADDYNPNTNEWQIANKILNLVTPGTIIGLHDGGGNRAKTVAALPIIISRLKSKGYEFLTIPELLNTSAYSRNKVVAQKSIKSVKKPVKVSVRPRKNTRPANSFKNRVTAREVIFLGDKPPFFKLRKIPAKSEYIEFSQVPR